MAAWLLWSVMLAGAVWTMLSELPAGAERRMPLPYLVALVPFVWIPMVLFALVAAVLHEWGPMCCLLAVALAASSRRLSYRSGGARRRPSKDAASDGSRERLRLMTLNCRYGRADADAIVREVRERGVDVLALQEVSADLVARLDRAGVAGALPHRVVGEERETDNGGFNVLFTALEPVRTTSDAVDIPAADVPSATLGTGDGRTVTFVSAHPKSPMRGCEEWSRGVIGLGALAADADETRGACVMGDLNSSMEHPSFRSLIRAGFHDASFQQQAGPNPTFPRWTRWPRLELDHILATRGARFDAVEAFEVKDTDHLALTARMTL